MATIQLRGLQILFVGAFLFSASFSLAEEHAENSSIFDRFQGTWTSDENAFGQPAKTALTWQPTLDGKFYQLSFKITMNPLTENPSVFEGTAYYQMASGSELVAFWADNTGDLHPITASIDGQKLTAVWGRPGKKLGRTVYEMLENGRLKATDWVLRDEGWIEFNQKTFDRVE